MDIGQISNAIGSVLEVLVAVCGAFVLAFWLAIIIWTWRDIRARSRDLFAAVLGIVLVAVFPLVGLLLYLLLRPKETLAEAYDRALEEEALLQEIEERPHCPGCSRVIDDKWLLCPHCHTRLKKACPDCNSLLELQWNLCPYCGNHAVDPYKATVVDTAVPAPDPLPEPEALEGVEPVGETEL